MLNDSANIITHTSNHLKSCITHDVTSFTVLVSSLCLANTKAIALKSTVCVSAGYCQSKGLKTLLLQLYYLLLWIMNNNLVRSAEVENAQ